MSAWAGLEKSDMPDGEDPMYDHPFFIKGMVWANNKLFEKNAARQPLTEEEMLAILVGIDAETKRLPPGMKAFARAIERAHGIGGGE